MATEALNYSFLNRQRRIVQKLPKNEFDKSTIVSIFPREVIGEKITLEPHQYHIPAGSYDKPALVVIGTASWYLDREYTAPIIEMQVPSSRYAESIVHDYVISLTEAIEKKQQPGIFWLPGEVTKAELILKHKASLDNAKQMQDTWYLALIKQADVDWARSRQNPLAVSDLSRMAADELGKKDKAWMGDFHGVELIPCRACGSLRNPQFPICPSCHQVIDVDLYKKLGIQQVQ